MQLGKILKDDKSYSFSSYFEMSYEAEEIFAEFGFRLERVNLEFLRSPRAALLLWCGDDWRSVEFWDARSDR